MITTYDPHAEIQARQAEDNARWNQELARQKDVEHACALLGYVVTQHCALPSFYVQYRPLTIAKAGPEQPDVARLGAVPNAARQRAADLLAAQNALSEAEARVDAYARRHGLSAQAANTKRELDCAELSTVLREIADLAYRDLVLFGHAAKEIAKMRSDLAAIPQRIIQRRRDCLSAEQADVELEKDLNKRLAAYGLLD